MLNVCIMKDDSQLSSIRNRFFSSGGLELADHELLALLLSPGRAESCLRLALDILESSGGLHALARRTPGSMLSIKGVGKASVTRLLAAQELGRRLAADEPRRPDSIKSSEQVARWFQVRIKDLPVETVHALLLDSAHHPLAHLCVGKGTWHSCQVDPKTVFSACLEHKATSVILAHNHPSGEPEPSRQDIELTERLASAGRLMGIKLLDHIIVGTHGYFSFAEAGLVDD